MYPVAESNGRISLTLIENPSFKLRDNRSYALSFVSIKIVASLVQKVTINKDCRDDYSRLKFEKKIKIPGGKILPELNFRELKREILNCLGILIQSMRLDINL